MKQIIIAIAIAAISFTACNNSGNNTADNKTAGDSNAQTKGQQGNAEVKDAAPVKEIVDGYLQIKNALANDNPAEAANAGKALTGALSKFDKNTLTAGQKKAYEDLQDDIKENGEHIIENSSKIEHQREHFEMLSNDVYDLVKSVGGGQTLYKDFCPMFNNKKGAIWLSETKEIKNPYLGKKMPDCGEVKEELK